MPYSQLSPKFSVWYFTVECESKLQFNFIKGGYILLCSMEYKNDFLKVLFLLHFHITVSGGTTYKLEKYMTNRTKQTIATVYVALFYAQFSDSHFTP